MLAPRIRRNLTILLTLACAFALGCLASVQAATADTDASAEETSTAKKANNDSIWLVSTRHLPCPCQCKSHNPDFRIKRYNPGRGWADSTLEDFDAAESTAESTAIYVHGNQTNWSHAIDLGHLAYRGLTRRAEKPHSIRFVIYSWPSDKICGLARDVRVKADRADGECCYLAYLLNRMKPNTHVGLFGFSFGGRIIAGALHVEGGGHLHGYCPGNSEAKPTRTVRAVLMGAAMHNYWILPGRRFGECTSYVDSMLVQYNSCDRVLRMYPRIERGSRPEALGHTGVPSFSALGENRDRVAEQNACCVLGKRHSAESYLYSETVMSRARPYLVW